MTPTTPAIDDRDPYAEGVEAHDTNHPQTANPYVDVDDDAEMSWNDGWAAAAEAATDDAMEDGQ